MVLLVITSNIAAALESVSQSTREELSLPAPTLKDPISHSQLITLSRNLSSQVQAEEYDHGDAAGAEESSYSLNSLLRGTKVYVPPPPPKPEPTPEYLALKASLQAEAESRKYEALLHSRSAASSKHQTSSLLFPSNKPATFSAFNTASATDADADADSDPLTPSVVLNVLVSVLFTGFATYWALSNFRIPAFFTFTTSQPAPSYPGAISSQPFRVFVSLLAGIGVGVAEVIVYAAYWRKVVAAKEKERKVVEKKVVLGEFKGSDGDGDHESNGGQLGGQVKESVEIWGKGPNGGARRRVRERWKERDET